MDDAFFLARFPGMDTVACVCPAEAAVVDPAVIESRREAHAAWVNATDPFQDKLLENVPLTADDMRALRASWNKYMPLFQSPYVPVRALIDPEWAVRACGTSAMTCPAAADGCPFRAEILAKAAAGHPEPPATRRTRCTVCDGNASLADVDAARTLAWMAAAAIHTQPFSVTPPLRAGRL